MTIGRPRRPPNVHRSPRPLSAGRGIAVADRLCVTLMRRPPSVHGSFDREGVQERDGVFAAVAGEVAVVAVDHRDARAHEARDREHRDAGAQCERGVGVAQVVEAANAFDASGDLGGLPVAAAEDAEVDPATARVRKEDSIYRGRQAVKRLNRLRFQSRSVLTGADPRDRSRRRGGRCRPRRSSRRVVPR